MVPEESDLNPARPSPAIMLTRLDMLGADLTALLRRSLAGPLPGVRAHRHYAPELAYGRHQGPGASNARQAAVLTLLYQRDQIWHLVLTLRPDHLPDHPGQVSFPGGALETGEAAEQGALRELDEELGVGGDCIELVGRLSPIYVFNSNFEVQPVVGVLEGASLFRPNAGEVAEVIEIPVPALLQCPPQRTRWRVKTSAYFVAPTIYWKQRRVWGATLLVLGELLEVLRETLGKTVSPGIARR